MPFGRFVGSPEVGPPADEVLVGREGQRAYLVDMLISTGRRGAYLVTGRRGAGKTSFVKHCIAEYEASVFSRFLRANVGRGFWDRALVLMFWLAILVGLLVLSEVLQLLVPLVRPDQPHSLLLWLVFVPIGVVLLYPCVYAKVVLEAILQQQFTRQPHEGIVALLRRRYRARRRQSLDVVRFDSQRSGIWATVAAVVFTLGAWSLPPFGHPALGVVLFIPFVGGLYFVAQAVSFENGLPSIVREIALYGLLALEVWLVWASARIALEAGSSLAEISTLSFAAGACFLGLGFILRGLYQASLLIRRWRGADPDPLSMRRLLWSAVGAGVSWYLASGVGLLAAGIAIGLFERNMAETVLGALPVWASVLIAGPMVLGISLLVWSCLRERGATPERPLKFRPRPAWLLGAKALLSIVVALQLAHPILSRLLQPTPVADLAYRVEKGVAAMVPGELRAVHEGAEVSRALASLPGLSADGSGTPLFSDRDDEWYWVTGLLLLVALIYFMEYEWVVRPYVRPREDRAVDAGDQAPWDDWDDELETRAPATGSRTGPRGLSDYDHERLHRSFAELTLPWVVYRTWLPVLPVAVNLGFDRLGHRQVVQAMLVGLRERYYRTFLAWNCWLANLGRFLGFLVLLSVVTLAGHAWFRVPQAAPLTDGTAAEGMSGPCAGLEGHTGVAGLACRLGELWYRIVYFDFVPRDVKLFSLKLVPDAPGAAGEREGQLVLFDLLPFENVRDEELDTTRGPAGLHFCAYHVVLFVGFFFAGTWVLRKIPLLPYKENLRRIDDLLDSLSARTKVTSTTNLWGPARWVHSVFSDERVRETERDPVDPRTVELAFLQILDDIQKGGFRFPGAARHHLTMPSPEITFMFDELDKLGTRVDPEASALEPAAQQQELRTLFDERERSVKLRALLSDLKNILASAPARFIFVGGRDLHDEWLADETARQPLLTSIFNTEVYLPSLLVDHSGPPPSRSSSVEPFTLDLRIGEYVRHQYRRAAVLHYRAARKRQRPSFGLSVEGLVHERYISNREAPALPEIFDRDTGEPLAAEAAVVERDFIRFLTHRSMGNAKRLKDLLASFIRPAGRELAPAVRWEHAPCRHVLSFDDIDIFRVQLLVTIYRHLVLEFEERMVQRDDKLAVSIFFLTDFLFKFHRRGFSWSNLERVDDLAHIHRLPDLRDIQEEIVDHFSERFLHRVLNGMYAFRFRSDVAREVEYLSRQSSVEMAAFNFTLDESQSLKASYLSAIEKEQDNPDLVAGLGELYEFDQEFERARHCYRQAIELLDRNLLSKLTRPLVEEPGPEEWSATVRAILAGQEAGLENARIFLPWGEARLRLMLQIGMSFEQARSLERATVEYRAARTLARALVTACTTVPESERAREATRILFSGSSDLAKAGDRERAQGGRLHTLKHLPIVFQPVFAEAWASEKIIGTIDTSVSLLEHSLWEIRNSLPFVRKARLGPAEDPTEPSHANFALTMSQLHNKLGDLYFFKGRQSVEIDHLLEQRGAAGKDRITDGYLLRAHYHYAVALHELRRYVSHRIESSKYRLSLGPRQKRSITLRRDLLPDFLLRAAASSLNDMAEATLARVSLFELHEELRGGMSVKVRELMRLRLGELCAEWLGGEGQPEELANWFGRWERTDFRRSEELLIVFEGPASAAERLLMSVKLCRVGAGYFEEGGYPEDAARELLQVCDTVTSCLWWVRIVEGVGSYRHELVGDDTTELGRKFKALSMNGGLDSEASRRYWEFLMELAVGALEDAFRLFAQSRHREPSEPYLLGDVLPAEALTLLCSLALASGKDLPAGCEERLRRLTRRWLGEEEGSREYRGMLETSLRRRRFPMINRLNGLKVLIDDAMLNHEWPASEIIAWADELRSSTDQFEAPFHFTPLRSGSTYALLYLRLCLQGVPVTEDLQGTRDRILHAAQRDLRVSEEMYTMRRSYYEAISDLYYLYDDFNDRQIHLNHALQMAGAELTCILRRVLDAVSGTKMPRAEQLVLPL